MIAHEPNMVCLVHFLSRHGNDAFSRLMEYLNGTPDGSLELRSRCLTHQEIAGMFQMDRGNLSRFVNQMFDVVYIPKPPVQEFLDEQEHLQRQRTDGQRRSRARILQLVTRFAAKDSTPPASTG